MAVIDVDTHWESTDFAPGSHPLQPWLDRLPGDAVERLAFGVAGDLLRALPPDRRPDGRALLPSLVRLAEQRGGPVILHPVHDSSAGERVAWMDRVGIDHCLVNPGGYWQMLEFLGADRAAAVTRCNDYLGEQLAGHADRLHGVAVVDLSDLSNAVGELERARARGHRAFFLYTLNGKPPGRVPPGHPDWDVVWSAAVRLGMVVSIHVGNTAADFSGWADIGWDQPGGGGVTALTRLANTQRIHVAQNLLVSMLYGGVFHRHPNLTVVLEEMKIGWVPSFIDACTRQSAPSPALGDWPYDVSGGDMLRRNVKVTPLPGFGDVEALDVLARLPEMCLFSSDYPHQEGNADPINLYRPALDSLDPGMRAAFLGGNAEDVFARTGDPL
ncbi:MAG TPA: amidohydrolase family protein [Acidimicrobiales bacterium]|nr:amidohydrolase family protein [Acidimicrobiales bacterium]